MICLDLEELSRRGRDPEWVGCIHCKESTSGRRLVCATCAIEAVELWEEKYPELCEPLEPAASCWVAR